MRSSPVNADEQLERFRGELIGRSISFVRLACNTLLLYVECEPGDGRGLTLWLEPTWHVSTPTGVVAGSRQAQGEGDDGPTQEEMGAVSGVICEALLNRQITSIRIDDRSRDLAITVVGEIYVRTFASDPDDDHSWHIRENATGLKVYASPSALEIHTGKP
jgi:hypothetical protein